MEDQRRFNDLHAAAQRKSINKGLVLVGEKNNRHIIVEISNKMLVISDCYEHQTDFAAFGVQAGIEPSP